MDAANSPSGYSQPETMSWAEWFGFDQDVRPYPHEEWADFVDAGAACVLGYGAGGGPFSGSIAPPVRWPSVADYLASLPTRRESQAGLPFYNVSEAIDS